MVEKINKKSIITLLLFSILSIQWAFTQNPIEKTYTEAYGFFVQNDYNSAINTYKKGIQLAVNQKDTSNILFGYSNIYGALLNQAKEEEFLKYLPQLKKYFNSKNVFLINIHCNFAGAYQKIADFPNSQFHLNAAINASSKIPVKNDEYYYQLGLSYNQNASHKSAIGDYTIAIQMHKNALYSYQNIKLKDEFVWNEIYNEYSNISRLNFNQGHYKEAQKYLLLSKPINKSNEFIKIINYNILMAQMYLKDALNKPDSALFYLKRTNNYYKKYKLGQLSGRSYFILAEASVEINDLTNANIYISKSLEIRLLQKNRAVIADCYRLMGKIKTLENKPNESIEHYKKAFEYLCKNFTSKNKFENPKIAQILYKNEAIGLYKEILISLGKINKLSGNKTVLERALSFAEGAHQLINYQRNSFQLEGSKLFLSEQAHAIYGLAIEAAYQKYEQTHQSQYIELAFKFSEANKAIVLFESIKANEKSSFEGVPQALIYQEILATKNMAIYENQLYKEAKNENLWRKKLIDVTNELAQLKAEIKKEYPKYYNFKYNTETITISEIQSKITDNQAVIEYYLQNKTIFTFLITKSKLQFYQQKLPNNFIEIIANYKNLILAKAISPQYQQLSNTLYQTLFSAKIVALLASEKIENLKIISDGAINFIPLEALITRPVKSLKETDIYLIENYTIGYLPSATMNWKNTKSSTSKWFPYTYIGFAPTYKAEYNLPDNQANVSKLASEFSGESFLAENATSQNFNKWASQNSKILHLSMHGGASETDQKESFLALEKDSLFVHDIYTQSIPTDLSILDACETGMGILNNGEGILNLARAFLHAGSQAVAMSLWKLSSSPETSQIISDFAKLVIDGTAKDKAISQAKLNYLAKNRTDLNLGHPYYWAPLIIIGNAEPIEPSYYKYWLILLALLIMYSWSSYRHN